MTIDVHLQDVREGIRSGRYGNEAAVSQGIVLRLLQALGWPTFNTQVVCPEYSLAGRRVDFALCHPANKPAALVEVKQIGQSDGAERQLFEYAFHEGVPLAILTDGQEWNFFLPAEQGDYSERRVYKLDLLERELSECSVRMERYLGYAQVTSGQAIKAAREDYGNVSRTRQMLAALPEAWARLIADEDAFLLELVADKVENLCGFRPDLDTVATFLRENGLQRARPLPVNQRHLPPIGRAQPAIVAQPPPRPVPHADQGAAHNTTGYSLDGRFTPCRNGREVLVSVFVALAERDTTFLERFAARPRHGRTRRYLARSPEELYPGRPDLAREFFAQVKVGWYLGTNVSHAAIRQIVEMACEVAGCTYGTDLVVHVGE